MPRSPSRTFSRRRFMNRLTAGAALVAAGSLRSDLVPGVEAAASSQTYTNPVYTPQPRPALKSATKR